MFMTVARQFLMGRLTVLHRDSDSVCDSNSRTMLPKRNVDIKRRTRAGRKAGKSMRLRQQLFYAPEKLNWKTGLEPMVMWLPVR